jgi:hypothetical protein
MIGHWVLAAIVLLPPMALEPQSPVTPGQATGAGATDLDQFMSRVLARRDDNWRKLQQYILEEREQADLLGPGGLRLYGLVREYTWYVRDGVFVRSPVRFDGVPLSEDDRRKYEDEWLAREKARDEREARKRGEAPDKEREPPDPSADAAAAMSGEDVGALMRLSREPQFVSAAYFLKFKFEQGRYAFAGPDTYEGRRVLKIEYYPARLFADDTRDREEQSTKSPEESEVERRLERQFNKVAMVTLWVEPDAHQIVKYVFENIGMDFMPARSLIRVDDVRATMEMGQPFAGVWLPRHIEGRGGVTLANGTYTVAYGVDYGSHREATTKATIR